MDAKREVELDDETVARLRAAIDEALADDSPGLDPDEVFQELFARQRARLQAVKRECA